MSCHNGKDMHNKKKHNFKAELEPQMGSIDRIIAKKKKKLDPLCDVDPVQNVIGCFLAHTATLPRNLMGTLRAVSV